jgi:hypothetical protein
MTAPLIAAVLLASGCGSQGFPGAAPAQSSARPSPRPCTSAACVITELQRTLIGSSVKDGSVFTALACKPRSLKHNAGNTYTVTCTATYSDGSKWSGYGTLLATQQQVTFEPENQVRQGG